MMSSIFKQFQKGFSDFGQTFAIPVLSIILIISYMFGIGLSRIMLGNKKRIYKNKNRKTYWEEDQIVTENIKNYLKQY